MLTTLAVTRPILLYVVELHRAAQGGLRKDPLRHAPGE
jgi:hypothetical protein